MVQLFKRWSRKTPSRGSTLFDIPLDAYDTSTQLPKTVVVGGQVIQPLVNIQAGRSHIVTRTTRLAGVGDIVC